MSIKIYQSLKPKLKQYEYKPVEFAKDVFGVTLDEWQETALRNINDNQKVAVAGATGLGKGYVSALAIWWFICCKEEEGDYPKLMATAPDEDTLKRGLWAQLSELYRKAPLIQLLFNITAKKIYMKGAEKEWFCVLKTTSARYSSSGDAQAESLAGMHARWTLTVLDEGSGLARANIEAILGSSVGPQRKIVMMFNPLRTDGYPYQIYHDNRYKADWIRMNVSFYDCKRLADQPALRAERESWINMYGRNSPYVQARVFGQFPVAATVNRVFSLDEVNNARERNPEIIDDDLLPVQIGVDCARYGDCETVYYVRRGLKSLEMLCESQTSGPHIEGRCVQLAMKWCNPALDPKKHVYFIIDETGVGGSGPVDHLIEQGWIVAGVNNGSTASLPDDYKQLGDELWLEDAKDAIRDCGLWDDDILTQQLLSRTYTFTGKSKQRRISTKEEMRSKKIESPDRADAFILAFANPDKLHLRTTSIRSTIDFF